jgi:hypothetical protein
VSVSLPAVGVVHSTDTAVPVKDIIRILLKPHPFSPSLLNILGKNKMTQNV